MKAYATTVARKASSGPIAGHYRLEAKVAARAAARARTRAARAARAREEAVGHRLWKRRKESPRRNQTT